MDTVKQNFDVNDEALNQAASSAPDINFDDIKVPSLDKILEMIQGMEGISDEEKSSLINEMLANQHGGDGPGISGFPTSGFAGGLPSGPVPIPQTLGYQFILLFSLLLVITLIFVLFGYKLYKSIIEKERKREEKRKQKQMKKKK